MYTIKEFSQIIGVSTQTLRVGRKNNSPKYIEPAYICPNTNYRYYVDSQAYAYNKNNYVIGYISIDENEEFSTEIVENFKRDLNNLGVNYKLLVNRKYSSNTIKENNALKELLSDLNEKKTYHILTKDSFISQDELDIIELYLEACNSTVKLKDICDFSKLSKISLRGINSDE